jgi:chromosome segregation protein
MTQINKIVMHGFKSFANRTELLFEGEYNCILGPNGSGKSNVLDALCFVLGKSSAKGLRAEKSSNLIYNGGKSKKPAKSGEVSIYFDNTKKTFPTEEGVVKISRIVTQKGASKYKINDETRTRQQIIDLLATAKIDPDGYNIILQGDIVRFVEMSPNDRRLIIEEISGIGIYEDKKQKALKELEKVDGKLSEAEIILKERQTYLQELKKDRDQALKFKEVTDKIQSNKASYLKMQLSKKEETGKKLQERHDGSQQAFEKKQGKIREHKQDIENKRGEIRQLTQEVEEKGEKEQIQLQKEIEEIRVEVASNKTRINSLENELSRIDQRKEQLQRNLEEIKGKMGDFDSRKEELLKEKEKHDSELKTVNEKIAAFKKKHKIDDETGSIDQKMEDIDKRVEALQKEVQKLREEQQEHIRQRDKIDFQVQTVDGQISKLEEIEKENKLELDELKQQRNYFQRVMKELNTALEESSGTAVAVKDAQTQLFNTRQELERLKLQQTRVVEQKAGSLAVKKILEQKSQFGRVYGTVSQLGRVKAKHSIALEVAAGPRRKNVVVESDGIAAKCIEYLKNKKLGIATFLPLNKLKAPRINGELKKLENQSGVHGLAIDLISYDSQFEKVFQYVFGNTVVVDDVATARRLGIGTARMVTLSGDLIELSGAMQGGFRQKRSSFQETDVSDQISSNQKQVARLQAELKNLNKRQEDVDKRIVRLREEKAGLEGDIIKREKSLHVKSDDFGASNDVKKELEKEGQGLDDKIEKVNETITEKNRTLADLKTEKQQLKEEMNKLRSPVLLAELTAFEQKQRELNEETARIETELKAIDMQAQEILGRDQENIAKILKDQEKEETQFREELKGLRANIDDKRELLKEKEEVQTKFYARFKAVYAERNKLNEGITRLEKLIDEVNEKARKDEYSMNSASLELARVKAEIAGLQEEYQQYEGVPLNLNKSEEQLKKEIREFERMKDTIGSVNMRSLDVYEQVEKEYKGLTEKRDTLMRERDDVMQMMTEIEDRKQDLFLKNYENINENFQKIFTALSSKGEASLDMEDSEKPLEGGVQIKVRLTGTKFMDIRSLSGGEKTMTALAFIFAIQEYDPASFYVLDEVDAALDKHNSEKFAKLIRKYAEKAQYIIISHNDAVVSEADSLYGVSMNEHGVTNVVSLKI